MTGAVTFVRFRGGALDGERHQADAGAPWPPPERAWFVRDGEGLRMYERTPGEPRHPDLVGFVLRPYRRVSFSAGERAGAGTVRGVLYEVDEDDQ